MLKMKRPQSNNFGWGLLTPEIEHDEILTQLDDYSCEIS